MNPYVAWGRALRARGHDVIVLANPHFQARIERAGLHFEALGTEQEYLDAVRSPLLVNAAKSPGYVMRELIINRTAMMYTRTREVIARHKVDAVGRHLIAFGAGWAAQQAGLPCASGVLAPAFWLSTLDPTAFRRYDPENPPAWFLKGRMAFARFYARFAYDPSINRVRRELGLRKLKPAFIGEITGGDVSLGLWSPTLRGPLPDDPAHGVICGFTWFDGDGSDHPDEEPIERFLADGEPPIVFTLGTSVVHHGRSFYPVAAEACRRLGRRGLLLVGPPENRPKHLPKGTEAFGYAPFSTLLHRGCATVHHGGIGTTAQGLRSGRPTVVVPHANDEFDNANRVKRLGVSATLHTHRFNADTLERALRSVLEDPATATRAAGLAPALRAEDGAARAAREMEKLAGVISES